MRCSGRVLGRWYGNRWGFPLRSFVNPPPRFRFSHPYPSLAEPASCAWVLGALRWGGRLSLLYMRGNSSFDPGPWQRCRTKDRQGCIMPSSCGAGNAL